jgi:16S rRNA (uracil1498-N3)-methyltransferase
MKDAPRLYVEASLTGGVEFDATPEQAHYLSNVMRLAAGREIALFNGRDGEWRGVIAETGKKKARFRIGAQLRPQAPEPDLWLLFALVKRQAVDLIIEKATELGVSRILPVVTERTNAARTGEERLRLIAIEAAEQCERLSVPEILPAQTLSKALTSWEAGRTLYSMDETGAGRPIAEVLAAARPGPAALLIGPEGGFAKSELDGLDRLAFATRVGLGRRILRAETAVIAALACFQAIVGDWR